MKARTALPLAGLTLAAGLIAPASSQAATQATWPDVGDQWDRIAQIEDRSTTGLPKVLGGTQTAYRKYRVICKGVNNQTENTAFTRTLPDGSGYYNQRATRWDVPNGWGDYSGGKSFRFTVAMIGGGNQEGIYCFLWGLK